MSGDASGYIAALDVGTTTIRCQIINKATDCVGSAFSKVKLHYPDPNCVEIDPEELWDSVVKVVQTSILDANITIQEIKSLGICTQRSTFMTWKKSDGRPIHNLITWKDIRAWELIKRTNKSCRIWVLRLACKCVYFFTRLLKFKIVGNFKFTSAHATLRLLWLLQNHKELKKAFSKNDVMFGTVETWLLYKLSGQKVYVTDISNASATGMYDPFNQSWSIIAKYFNVPDSILPPVVNIDYDFGSTADSIFGVPIKIGAVMSDQSAAMYGSCSFSYNDLKITMGTGVFLNVNTRSSIQGGIDGTYPLVGWKDKAETVYLIEIPGSDAGSLVEWMLSSGFISNLEELNNIPTTVKDNGGVYFIPGFSGLGPPINNENAASGFIGIKPDTRKEHMIRAVLESIVFKTVLAYKLLKTQCNKPCTSIKVDGGVSRNNFICQLLADLTDLPIKRLSGEMGTLGVAFVAGLSSGFWKSKQELSQINKVEKTFNPTENNNERDRIFQELNRWTQATERFKSWYQ